MYILTEYLDRAMAQAVYDKLDDGTYGGRIPPCPGVVVFPGFRLCAQGDNPALRGRRRLPQEVMQLPGSKGGYILNWTPEVQMEIPIKNGSNWCGWVYNRN